MYIFRPGRISNVRYVSVTKSVWSPGLFVSKLGIQFQVSNQDQVWDWNYVFWFGLRFVIEFRFAVQVRVQAQVQVCA